MGHKRKLGKILISAVASSALPTCSRFCITSRDRRPPFLLLVQCAIYNNLRSSSTYTTPREVSYFSTFVKLPLFFLVFFLFSENLDNRTALHKSSRAAEREKERRRDGMLQ